jgi:hypothetical protein
MDYQLLVVKIMVYAIHNWYHTQHTIRYNKQIQQDNLTQITKRMLYTEVKYRHGLTEK